MQNWWIAAFEHFGLITREEAEHIANNIKLSIHKENYKEAFSELEAILKDGKLDKLSIVSKLEGEIAGLRADVDKLQEVKTPTVAKNTKA